MLWAQNRADPRAQAVLKKMAEPGAILHLPARPDVTAAIFVSQNTEMAAIFVSQINPMGL